MSIGNNDSERSTYIHDTTVDVTELLEAKEPGAVCGVIEGVGLYSCIVSIVYSNLQQER